MGWVLFMGFMVAVSLAAGVFIGIGVERESKSRDWSGCDEPHCECGREQRGSRSWE